MKHLVALFWFRLGQWLDSRGMDRVAETCYRFAATGGGKRGATALAWLGKRLVTRGALQEGLSAYQECVRYDPANVDAWCGLGVAYRQSSQLEDARRCYDRALEIDPANLHALTCLGELILAQGDPGAALSYFDRVLEQAPLFYEALVNRVAALNKCDKLAEAEQAARQAIECYPDSAALHFNLGCLLKNSGLENQALAAFKRALEIQPDNQEALFSLAVLQNDSYMLQGSVEFIRRKIKLEGESADLQTLLAIALRSNEQMAEAETVCRNLLEQHPAYMPGWNTLGQILLSRGDTVQAIECFRKALALQPKMDLVFTNILFASASLSDLTPEALFKHHLEWAEHYETPLLEKQFRHSPGKEPEKSLKIGYVSGDCCNHPVANLLRGVLQQHDHGKFEIHCFSTAGITDDITAILRANCDFWHEVQLLSVDELADLIQVQGIDILVDLSGHTAFNRLIVFALKPAPIQASWIGYFHSTGLKSIDYFITDPYTTPQQSNQLFSEIPARLPHSRFCYTPKEFAPEVSKPPFEGTGYITFGSFNRLAKLTDPVIEAWSRIVTSVPNARLMIKAKEFGGTETVEYLKEKFEARGLSPDRLVLRPASDHLQTLVEYSEVDIALDPFPFNGGMTTMESLWMGVPVVALTGDTVVSRQSISVLFNIGLEELAFADVESYIAGAVALALDTPRMARLRSIIRPQMSRSHLCDAEQFTQDLEMLYRRMWQAWCRSEKLGPEIVPGIPVARKILPQASGSRIDSSHLLEFFQKRWEARSEIHSSAGSAISYSAQDRIEIVSATRLSESEFWNKTALGISLRRLAQDTRIIARIAFENQRGLPDVYNASINSPQGAEHLVLIHDDVWIDDYFLADHVIDGLKIFDVIGVAGNRRRVQNQPAWAFIDDKFTCDTSINQSGRVAHDSHPFGEISFFGAAPAECELLDGLFLAVRKSRLKAANVQFDPRFDFHLYDLDFCRSARKNGLRLGTWPISLTHQSKGAFGSPRWKEKYRLYLEKWEA